MTMSTDRQHCGATGHTLKRRSRRGAARIAVLVLPALALAVACGNSPKTADSASTEAALPTVPAPTAAVTPEAASSGAPDLAGVHVTFTPVASGLQAPTDVLWRKGDPRMYVAEQGGQVRIIDPSGQPLDPPVLSIPVVQDPRRGLLSATFSPDGTKLYALYVTPDGDARLDEFPMQGDVATAGRTLLAQHEPTPNHNIGRILFGPDGMLYVSLGDGASRGDPLGNAQELGTIMGKILRISPTPVGNAPYAVPADNPFVGRAGARPEIWMYGLRNPWRFSFDLDGTMWIGDPGEDKYDEVNVASPEQARGANWGWNLREGLHPYKGNAPAGALDPVIELPHADTTNCSVNGGYVYRGRAIPALYGAYLHGDACNPDIIATAVASGKIQGQSTLGQVRRVMAFGRGPDGEIYVVSAIGTVYRMDPA